MKTPSHIKVYVFTVLVGFFIGGIVLAIFATVQKLFLGSPITPVSYTVPIIFGGISGAIIAFQYLNLKINTAKVQTRYDFLTNLLDTVPLFIWSSAIDNGDETLTFQSRAAESITGYPPEKFRKNTHWLEIVHPDDRERVLEKIRRNQMGEIGDAEYRIIHADGSIRWVHSITTPITDASGKTVQLIGSIEDITARVLVRQKFEETQNQLYTLINSSPDIICLKDGEGRWLEANKADLQLFQLENVDYRGKKDSELAQYSPFYYDAFMACEESDEIAWQAGTLSRSVEIIPTPTGQDKIYDVIKFPVFNNDGSRKGLIVIGRDITEQHAAETALRQSEERYRNLIDNSPVGIVILRNEKIAYANPTLAKMLGYTPDELIGKPITPFIHPDYQKTAKLQLGKLMQADDAVVNAQEGKMVRKDGSVIDILILGQTTLYQGERAIQGYIYDITEQNQMRKTLEESETRYQQLIEFLPQSVVVHVDGKIKYANPAALALVGAKSLEEMLDAPLLDFVHPDDRERIAERIRRSQAEKKPTSLIETRIIRLDGNIIYGETSGQPIVYQGQEAALSIVTDITERKKLSEQLRQSQKMEAIGRLAGGVAHDFNNLLTAMMGYIGLLEPQLPAESEALHDLNEIKQATNRAADLVRQLLAFSRQQIIQPRLWNLNNSVNSIQKMLRRLIGEDVELHTFLSEGLGFVKIDPGHVEQIIMNLAVNARDAMPNGGQLTLETANVYLDEEYSLHHPEVTPGEYVLLAISDTGSGIPSDVMEHIFEPFFTTKEVGKGTGLGLATVHGIVKQNNGHIWVYSEPSQGTTFKIYFPRVHTPDEPDFSEQSAPVTLPSLRGTETILLVEDEVAVRKLTEKLLVELGYTVLVAADGNEALDQLSRTTKKIDLLLTDVVTPGRINGRMLSDAIQKISPETHVLYMSGYTDNVIVHHHILDPGLAFIQKPFTPFELARAVRLALQS